MTRLTLSHKAPTAARASWRSEQGAFDLPSILVGVLVVVILTAGVLAAVFGVIPWSQDEQAKGNLAAVRTAEGTHVAKDKGFVDLAGLQSARYLPASAEGVSVSADAAGTCYLAVAKSGTGKIFYSTDKANEPRQMTPSTPATPGSTVLPCIGADAVQDLIDDTGGYSPDEYTPIGDGDGTNENPGIAEKTTTPADITVTPNMDVTTESVAVTDTLVTVAFHNTSDSPTTITYAGRVTCYDPSRNLTTVQDMDGYFDLNSNIFADMTLVACSPGTEVVSVEVRPFDATYTTSGSGAMEGGTFTWRSPGHFRQATWVSRGLTSSAVGNWCIENKNNSSTAGNPIFLAPCASVDAQRWQWNGDGELRQSSLNHKCAGSAADKMVLADCATAPGQRFKAAAFQGTNKTGGLVQIVDAASGKCVDVPGGSLANVQLIMAPCNGSSTQSWYMPGLAATLAPELQQPQTVVPEPMTPVADANTVGMEMVVPDYYYWRPWFADRTVTAKTTTGFRIMFGLNGATNSANYDVQWSGAALNATGLVLPTTTTPTSYGSPQITWYGDVSAAPGGFKEGTGYVTATVTEKATGKKSVKSWKITVDPLSIVSPTSLTGWSTSYWPDRATTEMTTGANRFAFAINNAKASDFTVSWSGGGGTNATPGSAAMSEQPSQGVYWSDFTAGSGGYAAGTSTITATVTHVPTGYVMTKTWTLTVNPAVIVSPTSLTGWSTSYWPDRASTEMTTGANRFAFAINNAKANDFNVVWSGGSAANASPGAGTFSDQGSQGVYWSDFTAGTGGYTAGTSTITATVTHVPTGRVMTKTWTLTVNTAAIVSPTSLTGWSTSYWPNRTVTTGSTANTRFAFAVNNAKAGDFTVSWSGGAAVNAAPGTGTLSVNGSQGVYYSDYKPGTGGYAAGASTITATVTHVPTGRVMTKTWTLTAQ